jgi:hypothetical protein
MGMWNEGKPLKVKPYQHPHYQEIFQGQKIVIDITKEEYGIINNIDGIRNHKTIIQ